LGRGNPQEGQEGGIIRKARIFSQQKLQIPQSRLRATGVAHRKHASGKIRFSKPSKILRKWESGKSLVVGMNGLETTGSQTK
jgi:hypothetical protein